MAFLDMFTAYDILIFSIFYIPNSLDYIIFLLIGLNIWFLHNSFINLS